MPKSWTGSRYTGYSCTSSRLRKVASAVTGPGVTTCRLVRIRPRSASTTNPVACAVVFHSVSKARTASMSIDTTLLAIRSRVTAQSGLPSTAAACCATCAACCPVPGEGSGGACAGNGWEGPCCAGGGCCTAVVAAAVVLAAGGSRPSLTEATQTSRHNQSTLSGRITILLVSATPNWLTAEQNEQPDDAQQYERHEHGGRADVLGKTGEHVALESDAVHGRLDGAIDELHDEDQQDRADQQGTLHSAVSEPQAQWYDEHRQGEFLPERGLVAESAYEALDTGTQGPDDPGDAPGFVTIYCGCAVGFHVRSNCLAARTSSRRRTGMVCGALVTRSGSCSASVWICAMAATKASSVSFPSVSVGSISRHSGTSSGK